MPKHPPRKPQDRKHQAAAGAGASQPDSRSEKARLKSPAPKRRRAVRGGALAAPGSSIEERNEPQSLQTEPASQAEFLPSSPAPPVQPPVLAGSQPQVFSEAKRAATYMPGLDAVGHGIYLRPHQPYELKGVLFRRENYRPIAFKDAEQAYSLPSGYDVDDSPPMPANQLLNQTLIEESFDRFSKQMSLDTNLSVGAGAFSVSATASYTGQMRTSEEAYYALRSSFIPLWSVYLSDSSNLIAELGAVDLPVPFKHEHRVVYERFFERYGSHYVKRVWIGGKAQLFLTIFRTSGISKEEVRAGLKASYGVVGKGDANAQLQHSREKLQSSSQCSVAGKGGDELKLAALSSLDEAQYNAWLQTIRQNPQTVELEVAGIWTLFDDQAKAAALRDAYVEATSFTAISAAFAIDRNVYFVRGRNYFCYHIETQASDKPRLLTDKFPALAEIGFERIDAAFCAHDLISSKGENLSRKIYFFDKDQVARIDVDSCALDPGYPRLIREEFPGVDFEAIDATLEVGRDTVFFFSGNRYIRFSMQRNAAEEGYPDFILTRWHGVTFERIDAVIYWGNGKVFFFREDQHIRYDLVTRRSDPGYPKQIIGNYVEDWRFFD